MNKEIYQALIEDITDEMALLANTSAYLNQHFEKINWVGFYRLINQQLVLGPFQGKIACVTIELDKGVCGHVARTQKPIIVPDVDQFPGHIVCDDASKSEMVLPMMIDGQLYGVLDIDSPYKNRFQENDLTFALDIVDALEHQLTKIKSAKALIS